jgi:DNA-binding GntR family transcriptional regulator
MYTEPHTASDASQGSLVDAPTLSPAVAAKLRREQAYLDIRNLVLVGEFPFGQRLAEEAIAEQLGVSRTPVREAFARLHADRLVNRYADGGFYVAEPDLIDLRDLYELRLTLELRGISRASETGIAHDRGILESLRDRWLAIQAAPPEPGGSFIELDESFHVGLSRASGNIVITETLESVNSRIRPVRMHDFLSADRIELSIVEHLEILDATIEGDLELASTLLRHHIGISMEVVEERAARAMTLMMLNRSRRRQ